MNPKGEKIRINMSNRLTRLRISHVEMNEFVLMESLKSMVSNVPQIQELNL